MPSAEEGASAGTPLKAALDAGLESLSLNQEIVFTPYLRVILPLDGFAFWVKADLLSDSAIYNTGVLNRFAPNEAPSIAEALPVVRAKGSLHVATTLNQNVDETIATNSIVFTAQSQIRDLDAVHPNLLYIGEFQGKQFAFNRQGSFYAQAGLWHYRGDAVNGALLMQVIDNPALLDTANIVTSNSLAIWLTLDAIMPMYPAHLVPDNLRGPYAAVYIDPNGTEALQMAPVITSTSDHYQLVKDRVKITIYGLRNFNALDFQDYIFDYSLNTDNIGIMNVPIIRDEHRTMAELSVIAQKKSIDFDVSYYQTRIRDIARQFILRCIPSVIIMDI